MEKKYGELEACLLLANLFATSVHVHQIGSQPAGCLDFATIVSSVQ